MKAKGLIVKDKKWQALKAKLGRLKLRGSHVKIGIFGGTHSSGVDMATLLLIHELGTPTIPARAPVASTFRDRADELSQILGKLADLVITDKITVDDALNRLGLWGSTAVKNTIVSTDLPPPLKASTVERKGSSKPLVDTGQLLNAITWQVVK